MPSQKFGCDARSRQLLRVVADLVFFENLFIYPWIFKYTGKTRDYLCFPKVNCVRNVCRKTLNFREDSEI